MTGFKITEEFSSNVDSTIVLEWDPPTGSGPDTIIDNYAVHIFPKPISHSISNTVFSSPLLVSINFGVIYTATITAENCVGRSTSSILNDIEYGNFYYGYYNSLHSF